MAGEKPDAACAASASAPAPAPASGHASASASAPSASADADVMLFRFLLPRAFGDEDALHLYAAIAPLRHLTAALQVHVQTLEGYDEASASRVALILGPTSPSRRVEASSSSGEPLHLSPVQEALVAVLDVGGVLHRADGRGPEFMTCLLLLETAGLDAVILMAIACETGAEIRVASLAGDAKPSIYSPEEFVEITGDRTTIKNAILAISSYAQDDLCTQMGPLSMHSGGFTQYADGNIPRVAIIKEMVKSIGADISESVLQKPATNGIALENSKNEEQRSEITEPADEVADRIKSSCIARFFPPEVVEQIVQRLPPNTPIPSTGWLRMIQTMPRPTLLLPRHADDEWKMLLPATLAIKDDTFATSTVGAGRQLRHTTISATANLGMPASVQPIRLIGGHPSHPIFMQGQVCMICNVVTDKVYHHQIPSTIDGDRVLRGSISHPLQSTKLGLPGGYFNTLGTMLLLATDCTIFGRPVKDRIRPWAVGSLRMLQGEITDVLFVDGTWFLMDNQRHLYRISISEFTLMVQEVVVEMVPAQIFRNVRRHWILQWPGESILCICLQSHMQLAATEACYSAYLLRYCKGEKSYWQQLHYLHDNTVFLNSGKAQGFAMKYPQRWGLKQNVVYHADLTDYDLGWINFPNGLPEDEVHWPFPVWLLCNHL